LADFVGLSDVSLVGELAADEAADVEPGAEEDPLPAAVLGAADGSPAAQAVTTAAPPAAARNPAARRTVRRDDATAGPEIGSAFGWSDMGPPTVGGRAAAVVLGGTACPV